MDLDCEFWCIIKGLAVMYHEVAKHCNTTYNKVYRFYWVVLTITLPVYPDNKFLVFIHNPQKEGLFFVTSMVMLMESI